MTSMTRAMPTPMTGILKREIIHQQTGNGKADERHENQYPHTAYGEFLFSGGRVSPANDTCRKTHQPLALWGRVPTCFHRLDVPNSPPFRSQQNSAPSGSAAAGTYTRRRQLCEADRAAPSGAVSAVGTNISSGLHSLLRLFEGGGFLRRCFLLFPSGCAYDKQQQNQTTDRGKNGINNSSLPSR